MSKYIIELDYDFQRVVGVGVKQGTVWVKDYDVDDLEELCADYINENYGDLQDTAYQRGLEDGKQTAVGAAELREKLEYQKGFKDGKAQAERGCEECKYGGTPQGDSPCYNCSNYYQNNWTAKDDKIEVGDEVTDIQSGANFLVTHLWESNHGDKGVSGFNNDCSAFSATLDKVSKTGRHFDIGKILEDMRE